MTPREKCFICGMPINKCICDDEDFEDDGETAIDFDNDEIINDEQ